MDHAMLGRPDTQSGPHHTVLTGIQDTPLQQMSAKQVDGVVRRVLRKEPGTVTIDVARFNSAI